MLAYIHVHTRIHPPSSSKPQFPPKPPTPHTGASGDSENSGPQPADEGFFSFLRSFIFPNAAAATAGGAAPTTTTPGRFSFSAMAARVGQLAGGKKGGEEVDGAATAITIAPSPGKGDKKKGKKEGEVRYCGVGWLGGLIGVLLTLI